MKRIDSFLRLVADQGASDLHFHAGNLRKHSRLTERQQGIVIILHPGTDRQHQMPAIFHKGLQLRGT